MFMPTWLWGRRSVTTCRESATSGFYVATELSSGAGRPRDRWRWAGRGARARERRAGAWIWRHHERRLGRRGAWRVVTRQLLDLGGVREVPAVARTGHHAGRRRVPAVAGHAGQRLGDKGVNTRRGDEHAV